MIDVSLVAFVAGNMNFPPLKVNTYTESMPNGKLSLICDANDVYTGM